MSLRVLRRGRCLAAGVGAAEGWRGCFGVGFSSRHAARATFFIASVLPAAVDRAEGGLLAALQGRGLAKPVYDCT